MKSRSPWSANMPGIATPTSRSTNRSTTRASPIGRRFASKAFRAKSIEQEGPERLLTGFDGILVPGGFGERGIEGKVESIRFARERGIPFFGICLGMQCAVIEFGRNVVGLGGAHSTEFNKDTPHPVICLLDEQRSITDKGGTMRLGAQQARLDPASRARACYGRDSISERHRHRYEFNNVYRQQFEDHGMLVAATNTDVAWSRSSSCPSIPGLWPCNFIRSSNRSRRQPIRCLPASSRAAVERHATGQWATENVP